jgi:folate-binding protein YgfZ
VRDVGTDFEAICGAGAGWLDLSARGRIRIGGADRVRFLDGMLSSHVAALAPGASHAGLLLDRKGHVLATLLVLARESDVLLDTAPGTGPLVAGTLAKFVVADDVAVEDLGRAWSALSVEGPEARAALARIGVEAPPAGRAHPDRARPGLLWWGAGELTPDGVRALGPVDAVAGAAAALALPRIAGAAAEILRVEAGVPRIGAEIGERTLPPEAGLEPAISYTKGCFVGQEIVARLRSRGGVNRLLVRLRSGRPLSARARVLRGEVVVGAVTSAVISPASGPVALAYVRTDAAVPGTELSVDGVTAVVSA